MRTDVIRDIAALPDDRRTKQQVDEALVACAVEIDRLRSLIETTANHWLALQDKHPIQWEGAIDGAMAAACAEIVKLREAHETVEAELTANERMVDKLRGKLRLFLSLVDDPDYDFGKLYEEFIPIARAALGETE